MYSLDTSRGLLCAFTGRDSMEIAMKQESFLCDICKAPKQASSGWWLARLESPCGMRIESWDDAEALLPGVQHLCGEGCLTRAMLAWARHAGTMDELEKLARL